MKKIIAIMLIFFILVLVILFSKCKKEKKLTPIEKEIIKKEKIIEPSARTKIIISQEKEDINYDAFIMKIDADGNCVWAKTFGDYSINWIDFIIEIINKDFLVIGRNYSYNEKIDEIFLSCYDKNGNLKWTKILNKKDPEFKDYSNFDLNDGKLIIGKTYNNNDEIPVIYISKLDKDGHYDWSKNLGRDFYDWGYYTYNTYDGATIIIGLSEDIGEIKTDVYLLKRTKEQQVNKIFGGNEYDWGYSLARLKDGYLISGISFSFGNGLSDIYLIKIDSDGNCLFAKTIGDKGYDDGYCGIEIEDGFLIGGATTSYSKGGYDIYIVKTDNDGNCLWAKTYGDVNDDACYAIAKTEDNCFIAGGITGKKINQ